MDVLELLTISMFIACLVLTTLAGYFDKQAISHLEAITRILGRQYGPADAGQLVLQVILTREGRDRISSALP